MIEKIIKTTYQSRTGPIIRYWKDEKNIVTINPDQLMYFSPSLPDELKIFLLIKSEKALESEDLLTVFSFTQYCLEFKLLKIEEVNNIEGWDI